MGFEQKIIFPFNTQIKIEIQKILEVQRNFYNVYLSDNHLNFDYRENKMDEGMPDLTVTIEDDGLYICQYLTPKSWEGITSIKNYLKERNIAYEIEEI